LGFSSTKFNTDNNTAESTPQIIVPTETDAETGNNSDSAVLDFFDKEFDFVDCSELTPAQARREMKERKDDGEWLEFEEYGGYMNAINAEKDEEHIIKLASMSPDQISKWFSIRINTGMWNSPTIFDIVSSELKPHHEPYLLKEMDGVTKGRIAGWVRARKKEGYFFSESAYDKARKIYCGEIENRKSKAKTKG